jgi:hypothetical protein
MAKINYAELVKWRERARAKVKEGEAGKGKNIDGDGLLNGRNGGRRGMKARR